MGGVEWSLTKTIVVLFAFGRHCIKVAPSNQKPQQILRQTLCLALLARKIRSLVRPPILGRVLRIERLNIEGDGERIQTKLKTWRWGDRPAKKYYGLRQENRNLRSEERRVGKECRSR